MKYFHPVRMQLILKMTRAELLSLCTAHMFTSGGDENREYDESWTRTEGKLSKDRYSHYLQSISTVENNFRLSYEKDKKSTSEDVPQKLSWRKHGDKLKALTGLSSAKERTQNALSESTTNTMGSSKHTLQ
jgi:hypothetical protein